MPICGRTYVVEKYKSTRIRKRKNVCVCVCVCVSRVRLSKTKSEEREVRLVYQESPTHIMKVMSTNLRPTRRLIRATKFSLHAYSHISLSCPHPLLLPAAAVAETSSSPTAIITARC